MTQKYEVIVLFTVVPSAVARDPKLRSKAEKATATIISLNEDK